MVIASAAFAGLSWKVPVSRRLYHVITTLITLVAVLSYFAMATRGGKTLNCANVKHHHDHVSNTNGGVCREVYWARYVDWGLTTPLLLLELCLLAGMDGAHTIMAVAADLVMILAGLFAALGREGTGQKWGWYAIAWISYLFVIWHVTFHGYKTVTARGTTVVKVFATLAVFALILWIAYPM